LNFFLKAATFKITFYFFPSLETADPQLKKRLDPNNLKIHDVIPENLAPTIFEILQ
jgi:hypothetical protein